MAKKHEFSTSESDSESKQKNNFYAEFSTSQLVTHKTKSNSDINNLRNIRRGTVHLLGREISRMNHEFCPTGMSSKRASRIRLAGSGD